MKAHIIPIALLVALALTSTASGQNGTGGTISDGRVGFTQGNSPVAPTANGPISVFKLNGAGSPSQLFQDWWWYRVNGVDTRENAFNSATMGSWANNTGGFDFTFPNFTAELRYTVARMGTTGGSLTETMVITSTAANRFNLSLFNYQDIDVSGTAFNDSAALVNGKTIRVTDATTNLMLDYTGQFASNYMAAPSAQVRDLLTNNVVNDFASTGLPFQAGNDFTAGWEWANLVFNPGQRRSFQVTLATVPEPSSWMLAVASIPILYVCSRRSRRSNKARAG